MLPGLTNSNQFAYAALVVAAAAFLAPEGAVVVPAVAGIFTAVEAASAVVQFVEGDVVPAGRWYVLRFLDQRFPDVPWFLTGAPDPTDP